MNKSFHRFVAAAVLGICASCTTVAPPPPTASIATQEDAYILIGTSEEDYEYQFAIVRGNIDQDKFSVPHHFGDPPAYGPGVDGFIILKAESQATLGVGSVEILIKGTHLTALSFAPCKSTLVFTPQAGKVVYVGTVDLSDKRESKDICCQDSRHPFASMRPPPRPFSTSTIPRSVTSWCKELRGNSQ